jgi:APA family basic amino acid/polyamine antiporter
MTTSIEPALVRAIGLRRLTVSIVNLLVGAGIFVLPAIVAARIGTAAPLAYILCAVLMALVLTCFAAAGSRVSLTGGLYAYIGVGLGAFAGFIAGVLYLVMAAFAVSSVASALTGSLGSLLPVVATPIGRAAALAGLFGVLALVNVRGVKPGVELIEGVTAAKVLALVILVVSATPRFGSDRLAIGVLPSSSQLAQTCLILIYAFAGTEIALVPGGEIRNPARTIPRAVYLALGIVTLLYLAIQAAAQTLLGPALATSTSAPLAEAAARVLGNGGRTVVIAGAISSMFGYMAGDMLGSPRALFALGRDGMLPGVLASVHPRYRTPQNAIAVYAILVSLLAISSSFTELAILANVTMLTIYLLGVIAAWELQRRDVRTSDAPPFMLPAGPAVPIVAAAVIIWLLWQASRREFAVLGLTVGIAALAYFIRKTGRRL